MSAIPTQVNLSSDRFDSLSDRPERCNEILAIQKIEKSAPFSLIQTSDSPEFGIWRLYRFLTH